MTQNRAAAESHAEVFRSLASKQWTSLSDEAKLTRLRATFHHATIREMRAALPSIKLGVGIMAVCAIDFLSALAAGEKSTRTTFRRFCDMYLEAVNPLYDGETLYATRCGLVHNYSIQAHHALTWDQGVDNHLREVTVHGKPGRALSLERFIDDIETAGEAMFVQAAKDPILRGRILNWANTAPPISFRTTSSSDDRILK